MSVTLNNIGISLSSGSAPSTLLDGLMGYWKLDETSGNAVDSSGSGYTGTSSNITYTASGKISRCYTFNGTTSNVALGNIIKPTTALSFSIWTKDGGQSAEKFIIGNTIYDTAWRGWRFTRYTGNSVGIFLSDGSTYLDQAYGSNYSDDAWHNTIFTWNGTTAYFYKDGVKSSAYNWSGTISYNATHNLRFGANDSGSLVYDGEIDEVGIWNRALTDAEASWLYNSGSGLTHPFT